MYTATQSLHEWRSGQQSWKRFTSCKWLMVNAVKLMKWMFLPWLLVQINSSKTANNSVFLAPPIVFFSTALTGSIKCFRGSPVDSFTAENSCVPFVLFLYSSDALNCFPSSYLDNQFLPSFISSFFLFSLNCYTSSTCSFLSSCYLLPILPFFSCICLYLLIFLDSSFFASSFLSSLVRSFLSRLWVPACLTPLLVALLQHIPSGNNQQSTAGSFSSAFHSALDLLSLFRSIFTDADKKSRRFDDARVTWRE